MHTLIRPLQSSDLAPLAEIVRDSLLACDELDLQDLSAEDMAHWQEEILYLLTHPPAAQLVSLVATQAGVLQGVAQLNNDGEINVLLVAPAWQDQGIGAALLQEIALHGHCAQLAQLQVHSTHTAYGFFYRYGFRPGSREFNEWLIADLHQWKFNHEQHLTH
ncbi:GNAT family N-acetyltransferase [Chitinibacter sp. ZOR0017]|uniref:GNAT family N-acetyltransferase n=1 Tax=Chitinibacter sp. ZOR0017 TaxID=1339254 RepID=UPI0006487FC5|nr:GNAT family N-acetyltransferase [Chitinibacter sp. ZOR0017]